MRSHIVRALPDLWWNRQDSNPREPSYELGVLTDCTTVPYCVDIGMFEQIRLWARGPQ